MVASLKEDGVLGVVLPHGVLCRGGAEGKIRQGLLKDDLIEAVVGFGPNLSYGSGIPACIVVTLLSGTRVVSALATVLGITGLLLVALGLYGVLSYAVHERTHEFGIRAALGATASGIRGQVLSRGLRLSVGGMVVGMPLAFWLTRYVESRLYQMSPLDVPTYSIGVSTILLVAIAASWLPARRATGVSPVEALRAE